MSSEFHVVAKLKATSERDLVVTDEVKVAKEVKDAVERIGAWNGDMFAVWAVGDVRPNPAVAGEHAACVLPEKVEVFANGVLWPMDDACLKAVRQDSRG